jgi:hypothetical protein
MLAEGANRASNSHKMVRARLSDPGTGYPSATAVMIGATMKAYPGDIGAETEAYAAYLNAPRNVLDHEEQALFDQDLLKARAAMERAWLEAKPVREIK